MRHETPSALTSQLQRESFDDFLSQRVDEMRIFDVSFIVSLNKILNKYSDCLLFLRPQRRRYNAVRLINHIFASFAYSKISVSIETNN